MTTKLCISSCLPQHVFLNQLFASGPSVLSHQEVWLFLMRYNFSGHSTTWDEQRVIKSSASTENKDTIFNPIKPVMSNLNDVCWEVMPSVQDH